MYPAIEQVIARAKESNNQTNLRYCEPRNELRNKQELINKYNKLIEEYFKETK